MSRTDIHLGDVPAFGSKYCRGMLRVTLGAAIPVWANLPVTLPNAAWDFYQKLKNN